jgi:hypothetical protein
MVTSATSRTRRALRAAAFLVLLTAMLKALAVPAMASPAFWTIKVARQSFTCQRGLGICIDLFGPDASNATEVSFEVRGDREHGVLSFLSPPHEKGDTFTIDEDVTLDRRHSLQLGYQSVTLLKGSYPVDFSNNPNGEVMIGLRTVGVTVTIDVGRRSKDCTRFGICSVTVGIDLRMNHPAPATVSLADGKLSVDFIGRIPVPGDSSTFVIDNDIVLDDSVSLAFGARSVTILKGSYPVDYSSNPFGHIDFNVNRIGITVTIEPGRRSRDCNGFGICSVTIGLDLAMKHPTPSVVSLEGHHVTIDFLSRPSNAGEPFVLDEDIALDPAIAQALGRKGITLMAGVYQVDYGTNPNGRVTIPVSAQGIVITIYVGRPSQGCRGFGFCGITIDAKLATDRSVAAVTSVANGIIAIDFLGQAPDAGDVLTIDDDMQLDPAVARALGYHAVTLARGQYHVDYSRSPNGHVEIPVALRGITIKLNFGRAYADCAYKGLCSVTVELSRMLGRPVYGSALESNGELDLQFGEALPEQTDTLFIDEDIALEPETAQALGAGTVTVKRGAYVVDYGENPFGAVKLATNDDGTASVETPSTPSAGTTLSVWPNPAGASATVRFTSDGAHTVSLDLLDARGTFIRSIVDGERFERGDHEIVVDLAGIPAGAYFQRLVVGTTSTIAPLQIVR